MDPIVIVAIALVLVVAVAGLVVTRGRRPDRPAPPTEPPGGEDPATEAPPRPPVLRSRLDKTRSALAGRLATLLGSGRLDDDFWQELEDTLVAADLGVGTASRVVGEVRGAGPDDAGTAHTELVRRLIDLLDRPDRDLRLDGKPSVVLVVGVNGTGKTTSIAKLAAHLESGGSSVVLGAADTYRAAAAEQLGAWGRRVGVEVIRGDPGADPASVAYDAYHAARGRGADVVVVDTAGRLHSKANLMDELGKVARVLRREAGNLDEVLLVIDGTTGQNAIEQARIFTEAVGVTGMVVTKLDGTARGGVAVAVEGELDLPVKFIGVGEGVEDLIRFDPPAYVDALVGS